MKKFFYKAFRKDVFSAFNWEVDKDTPLKDACFVVFDTETTGLDLKRSFPISIGVIKIKNLSFSFFDAFHRVVKPPKGFGESIKVHGSNNPRERPKLVEMLKEFNPPRSRCLGGPLHERSSVFKVLVESYL